MNGNIAIFVPHVGCQHRCSFCDQNAITGTDKIPDAEYVRKTVSAAIEYLGDKAKNTEIAFFGGSFTAIPRDYMLELLDAAFPFVKNGSVYGIRLSTRPDAIDDERLQLLKERGVTAIELGAQSMDDEVLKKNLRGHTSDDVVKASELIKKYGFSLGLQMMTGLYGSDEKKDIASAEKIAVLCPDTVRIYPSITLENTLLARLFRSGEYIPPTIDETVNLCAGLLEFFRSKNIEVIKLGLHSSTDVEKNYVAGPYHQALRELCEAKLYLKNVLKILNGKTGNYTLFVRPDCISKMTGQHRSNIETLKALGLNCRVRPDESLDIYEIRTKQEQE